MKKIKLFLPKRLLSQKLLTKISLWLIGTILLMFSFLSYSFLEGIQNESKKNLIRNYTSHASISYSSSASPYSTNSWWPQKDTVLENLITAPYVRAISPRSQFSAYYVNKETGDYPIQIIGISLSDVQVFTNFMMANNQNSIAKDTVHIGDALANKLGLKIGDPFPFFIPSLDKGLTNFIIQYIYRSSDQFYDNYGVFVNIDDLSPIAGSSFYQYHMRFTASPFLNLVVSNVIPSLGGRPFTYSDKNLEFQYSKLKTLQSEVIFWLYSICFLIGAILFCNLYKSYALIKDDVNRYTYVTGYIPILSPNQLLLKSTAHYGFWIILSALFFTGLIISFHVPIISRFFIQDTGIFSQYNFPLPYGFKLHFPAPSFAINIIMGFALILVGSSTMMFFYHIFPNFLDPKNRITYIVLGFVALFTLMYIISGNFLTKRASAQSLENFWTQGFYGKINLISKNYLAEQSLNLSPTTFTFNSEIPAIFQQKKIPYLIRHEVKGSVRVTEGFSSTNDAQSLPTARVLDIDIVGIQGEGYPLFNEIMPTINRGELAVGKKIYDFFGNREIIVDIIIPTIDGTTYSRSFILKNPVEIPYQNYNSTIFIPLEILNQMMNQASNTATIIQASESIPLLIDEARQEHLILEKDMTKHFAFLNRIIILFSFVSYLLLLIITLYIFKQTILFFTDQQRVALIQNYFWGIKSDSSSRFWGIGMVCSLFSIIFGKIWNLLYLILSIKTPKFLEIKGFTPENINLPLDFQGTLLVSLSVACAFLLFFIACIGSIKTRQREFIKYLFNKDNS